LRKDANQRIAIRAADHAKALSSTDDQLAVGVIALRRPSPPGTWTVDDTRIDVHLFGDGGPDRREVGSKPDQDLDSHAFILSKEGEKKMFGPDVAMADVDRFAQAVLHDLLGAPSKRYMALRRFAPTTDDGLDRFPGLRQIEVVSEQRPGDDPFVLVEKAKKEMLGADVRMVE